MTAADKVLIPGWMPTRMSARPFAVGEKQRIVLSADATRMVHEKRVRRCQSEQPRSWREPSASLWTLRGVIYGINWTCCAELARYSYFFRAVDSAIMASRAPVTSLISSNKGPLDALHVLVRLPNMPSQFRDSGPKKFDRK